MKRKNIFQLGVNTIQSKNRFILINARFETKSNKVKSNYLVLFDVVEYVEQNKAMLNKILKNNCSLLFYDLLSGKHSIKILKSANKEHLLKSTIYISKKLKVKLPYFVT